MHRTATQAATATPVSDLFRHVRRQTETLAAPLSAEDAMLQSMEDASPAKWHLAHTTWFFEEFILRPRDPDYVSPDDRFAHLFNSYYVQAGAAAPGHARSRASARRVYPVRGEFDDGPDAQVALVQTFIVIAWPHCAPKSENCRDHD